MENRAFKLKLTPELTRIDEIAVVSERHSAFYVIYNHRLRVVAVV